MFGVWVRRRWVKRKGYREEEGDNGGGKKARGKRSGMVVGGGDLPNGSGH